jgi:hypothetical protein
MQYAKILAALDIEIDCLRRARDLLAGSTLPVEKPLKRTYSAPKKRTRKAKSDAALPLQLEQAPPQIQKVPYREKTRSRRRKSLPTALTASTALSGHVSAAPVVVSADEAQKARVRETEQIRSAQQAPEINDRNGVKSLDSLIRAFNRGHIPAGLEM